MSRKLMLLLCVLFARSLLAQEEIPFFVDPPKPSTTVCTDWQEVDLIYTLHWLDGYRPQYESVKPENMSFSPFELDPLRGYKLEKQNKRKYKKENYIDLVYHIRCMAEKKGEIPIPEQIFKYVKEGPGGFIENSEEKDFKTPGIMLRYDSVLTKDADDIIDTIDFGSFKKQEHIWKGLSAIPVVLFVVISFILFRKHTILVSAKAKKLMAKKTGQNRTDYQERLIPKEALKVFQKNLNKLLIKTLLIPSPDPPLELLAQLHEELHQLLASYVPEILDSDTPRQIESKIMNMEPGDLRDNLHVLNDCLIGYDNLLYDKGPVTFTSLSQWIIEFKESVYFLKRRGKIRKLLEHIILKCKSGVRGLYENIKNRLRRTR